MNDFIRKEFETAYKLEVIRQGKTFDSVVFTRESSGEYFVGLVQSAWWGWQTSRENIIIELPERIPKDNQGDYWTGAANGFNQCINSCAIGIKQAGLKVKP